MSNFTTIDNEILSRALIELNGNEWKVLTTILKHSYGNKEECFPSQRVISEETNLSICTVKRAIQTLQNKEFISISKHKNKSGFDNNVYHVNSAKETNTQTNEKKVEVINMAKRVLKKTAVTTSKVYKGPKKSKAKSKEEIAEDLKILRAKRNEVNNKYFTVSEENQDKLAVMISNIDKELKDKEKEYELCV